MNWAMTSELKHYTKLIQKNVNLLICSNYFHLSQKKIKELQQLFCPTLFLKTCVCALSRAVTHHKNSPKKSLQSSGV